MASGQRRRVTATSCSVRPDLRRAGLHLVVIGGSCRREARRGPGVRIRLTIEATPGEQGIPGCAATVARSSDRHPTVGLAVAGRGPASRIGPERNMPAPFDPCGPPGTARVSQPHISDPVAAHGSSLPVGCCCPATRHLAVNPTWKMTSTVASSPERIPAAVDHAFRITGQGSLCSAAAVSSPAASAWAMRVSAATSIERLKT